MRANEFLFELANQPYTTQLVGTSPPVTGIKTKTDHYRFTTDAGLDYEIIIKKFTDSVTNEPAIRVDFNLMTLDDEDSRQFRGSEIENTGDAYRVFATVRQCVADYIKNHDQTARIAYSFGQIVPGSHERPPAPKEIQVIQFQCQSRFPSRIKLYDRIAKTAGRWFPGFKLSRGPFSITEFDQPGIRWVLERESN